MYLFEYPNMAIDEKHLIKNKGEMEMRTIRTIAYISVALLIVSMLAIGAVSAKAGGNGEKMWNNGDGICDGNCLNDGVCPYNGKCVNAGDCTPNDYKYDGKRAHHNF